ncbi:MAG: protein translocase subunit SecF [Deltaproteobacteria bacterium]|nr:protein translocase subunit SecF [Deltaproteobacteria bacterium]
MEFIKPGIDLDFVGKRYIAITCSLILILVGIISLVIHHGPKFGIDFKGGTIVQVKFKQPVAIDKIKNGLETIRLKGSAVQQFGDASHHEYLIRTNQALTNDENFKEEVSSAISKSTGAKVDIRRIEMVGPKVGQTLREKALFALFYALLFITIYISGRFEQKWMVSAVMAGLLIGVVYFFSLFSVSIPLLIAVALLVSLLLFWQLRLKFAMGAIVALIHDVTITVGIFSLLGKEFTLPIIAALLTIVGYSLNDTIIVFDRIRENTNRYSRRPLDVNINRSINETLSRTILTSATTLVVLICLFFLGGDIIHDFSFALIIGIVVGTYSSVYVASPVLLFLEGTSTGAAPEKAGAVAST